MALKLKRLILEQKLLGLRAHPVDVLLTDVMMPDMNGVELYRETKKICPSLTAIFNDGLCC